MYIMEQCLNYVLKKSRTMLDHTSIPLQYIIHTTYHSHHDSMIMNSQMDSKKLNLAHHILLHCFENHGKFFIKTINCKQVIMYCIS